MPIEGIGSRAIIGRFYQRLKAIGGNDWTQKLGMNFSSDQESESYKWLGMSPAMREWIGPRVAKFLRSTGVTIVNKKFEATLDIDVNDKRRDKTGQIMVRVGELATRTTTHWRALCALLFNNGEDSAQFAAHDGQAFFSASHRFLPNDAAGAQKNLLTASEVPALDVATAAAPTQAEAANAVLAVINYMRNYKDDVNELVNEDAMEFIVMTNTGPLAGIFAAAIANANLLSSTGGAVVANPLLPTQFKVSHVANGRLDSNWDTKFAVAIADGDVKPVILQEELPVEIKAIAEGSELEVNEDVHRYAVKAMRNVGVGAWWRISKSTFS